MQISVTKDVKSPSGKKKTGSSEKRFAASSFNSCFCIIVRVLRMVPAKCDACPIGKITKKRQKSSACEICLCSCNSSIISKIYQCTQIYITWHAIIAWCRIETLCVETIWHTHFGSKSAMVRLVDPVLETIYEIFSGVGSSWSKLNWHSKTMWLRPWRSSNLTPMIRHLSISCPR